MTLPAGIDQASVILAASAIVGGIARAAMGQHPTLSRRTVLDILMGGALGVIVPLFDVVPTKDATPAQLAAVGFLVGLFGSYVMLFALYKLKVFREDIRAARPDENGKDGA